MKPNSATAFSVPRITTLGLSLVPVLVLALHATDAAPSAPARAEFLNFKIIPERNIFDASRSPGGAKSAAPERTPSRVDQLTLYGTMAYEKGPYAFFDSSNREFQAVLETGKTIAGLTIKEITGSTVILESGDQALHLHVGMHLRRENGGAWQLTEIGELERTATASFSSSPAHASGFASEENDIVKRLMQQREQETK